MSKITRVLRRAVEMSSLLLAVIFCMGAVVTGLEYVADGSLLVGALSLSSGVFAFCVMLSVWVDDE